MKNVWEKQPCWFKLFKVRPLKNDGPPQEKSASILFDKACLVNEKVEPASKLTQRKISFLFVE
jgi:hypothetical protein